MKKLRKRSFILGIIYSTILIIEPWSRTIFEAIGRDDIAEFLYYFIRLIVKPILLISVMRVNYMLYYEKYN